MEIGDFEEVSRDTRRSYSDGSGGQPGDREARRAGAGAAAAKVHFDDSGDLRVSSAALLLSSVPGAQTVPRAELHAEILCRLKGSSAIDEHGTDALYVMKGVSATSQEQREPWLEGTNCDLWQEEYRLCDDQRPRSFRKVKAHLGAHAIAAGVISAED